MIRLTSLNKQIRQLALVLILYHCVGFQNLIEHNITFLNYEIYPDIFCCRGVNVDNFIVLMKNITLFSEKS